MSNRVSVGVGLVFQYLVNIAILVELWSLNDVHSIQRPFFIVDVALFQICIVFVGIIDFLCVLSSTGSAA